MAPDHNITHSLLVQTQNPHPNPYAVQGHCTVWFMCQLGLSCTLLSHARTCEKTHCEGHNSGKVLAESCTQTLGAFWKGCAVCKHVSMYHANLMAVVIILLGGRNFGVRTHGGRHLGRWCRGSFCLAHVGFCRSRLQSRRLPHPQVTPTRHTAGTAAWQQQAIVRELAVECSQLEHDHGAAEQPCMAVPCYACTVVDGTVNMYPGSLLKSTDQTPQKITHVCASKATKSRLARPSGPCMHVNRPKSHRRRSKRYAAVHALTVVPMTRAEAMEPMLLPWLLGLYCGAAAAAAAAAGANASRQRQAYQSLSITATHHASCLQHMRTPCAGACWLSGLSRHAATVYNAPGLLFRVSFPAAYAWQGRLTLVGSSVILNDSWPSGCWCCC